MSMDILAILMVAFGLFAILMFVLFYIYAKKSYNERHISDNYQDDDLNEEIDLVKILINNQNYIFDANDYELRVNDNVRVNLDGIVYDGRVIEENYVDIVGNYKERPPKLILEEQNDLADEDINYNENRMDNDFIPIKKKDTM